MSRSTRRWLVIGTDATLLSPTGAGGHLGEDGRPGLSLRAFLHHEAFGGIR